MICPRLEARSKPRVNSRAGFRQKNLKKVEFVSDGGLPSSAAREPKRREFDHFAGHTEMTASKTPSRKLHRSCHFLPNGCLIGKFIEKAFFVGSRQAKSQVK